MSVASAADGVSSEMLGWNALRLNRVTRPTLLVGAWLRLSMTGPVTAVRAEENPAVFEAPPVLTASVYSLDGEKLLFKFKRTATQSGKVVHVVREYTYPDGKLAVRERVDYRQESPIYYQLDELQTGAEGTVSFERPSSGTETGTILFQYAASPHSSASSRTEALKPDTLLNDTVGPFLAGHFQQLADGEKVSCRCVVITHRQTIGFVLKKESEEFWHGKEVIRVKMEPSSFIISTLVAPLHLVIEKAAPHRVLEYRGRTTPKAGRPGHWSDLDAVTVFDW